jgi:DNA-binding LacI/PurR family transcriptional regulator
MVKKATIREVARHAGVSVATVSRVLNKSDYFDEETARKVTDAVQTLGYRRNVHWQRLSRNASQTISFLLGNRGSLNSMQMKMLVSCERVCKENGYEMLFSRLEYSGSAKAGDVPLPRILAEHGLVDGVILIGQHSANLLEVFERASLPWVLLGNNYDGEARGMPRNVLNYDDEAGCFEAAAYLARLGHRRLAFVGNVTFPWFKRRRKGFERAVRQFNLTPLAVEDNWDVTGIEYGRLAAAELLRRTHPPTAILASNDEVAAGVWKELVQRGVRIPQEMSLCGFGDREEFQILEPSLTTMAVFPDKLGAELARMMLHRLQGPEGVVESRTHPCQLIERGSSAPPASRLSALRK